MAAGTTAAPLTGSIAHVETIPSARGAEVILLRCDCPIGRDHTYAEWVQIFGRSQYDI